MSEWIKINSEADLPKKSGKYIVFSSNKGWLTFMQYSDKHKMFNVRDEHDEKEVKTLGINYMTHWMPCSAIPEGKWLKPIIKMPCRDKEILFKTKDTSIYRGFLYNDIYDGDLWMTFTDEFKTSDIKCWTEFPESPEGCKLLSS